MDGREREVLRMSENPEFSSSSHTDESGEKTWFLNPILSSAGPEPKY